MPASQNDLFASIEISSDQRELHCRGVWTLEWLSVLEPELLSYAEKAFKTTAINAAAIAKMDSAGALLFHNLVNHFKSLGKSIEVTGLNKNIQSLLNLIVEESKTIRKPPPPPKVSGFVYLLGEWV